MNRFVPRSQVKGWQKHILSVSWEEVLYTSKPRGLYRNPRSRVARANKFCMLTYFCLVQLLHFFLHRKICISLDGPNRKREHWSLQKYLYLTSKLLHVVLLASRIWRWLLVILKICALLPVPNGSKRINLSLGILPERGNGVTSLNVLPLIPFYTRTNNIPNQRFQISQPL
jgi:hypothetical protein